MNESVPFPSLLTSPTNTSTVTPAISSTTSPSPTTTMDRKEGKMTTSPKKNIMLSSPHKHSQGGAASSSTSAGSSTTAALVNSTAAAIVKPTPSPHLKAPPKMNDGTLHNHSSHSHPHHSSEQHTHHHDHHHHHHDHHHDHNDKHSHNQHNHSVIAVADSSSSASSMRGFGNSFQPESKSFLNGISALPCTSSSSVFRKYYQIIWADRDSRALSIFIGVSTIFSFIQLLDGVISSNVGVVMTALHSVFDLLVFVFNLSAILLTRKKSNFGYSYGFDRLEVLAGFTNAVVLVFVATFSIIEAFHHIFKNPEHSEHLLFFSPIELALDIFGLLLFSAHARLRPENAFASSGSSAHHNNLHGVFLHILADAFSNLGFICAAWLVKWRGWYLSNAVVSFVCAMLILWTVLPLFRRTSSVLLQTKSPAIKSGIDKCMREILTYDGVLECRQEHWWTLTPGVTVGSLHVRIRSDADEQSILCYVHSLLDKYVTYLSIQIEKDVIF